MAPLPFTFSTLAFPIETALSEGRTDDAKRMIVELLLSGKADASVQRLAADLIKPPKRARGRRKAHTRYWLDIGEQFHWLRDDGVKYEEALLQLSDKFGVSESHIRNAVAEYNAAKEDHDDAGRD